MAEDDPKKIADAVAQVLWRQADEDPNARSLNAKMKEAMGPVIEAFKKDLENRRSKGASEDDIATMLEQMEDFLATQPEIPAAVQHLVMGELRKAAGLR